MDRFYRFVGSIFPTINVASGAPSNNCFDMDDGGRIVELVFKMQPGEVMDLGKAHLKKIWDNISRWENMAFDILQEQYAGDAAEELDFRILEVYADGHFSLGYSVLDDPDNLHLFVDFSCKFIPSRELGRDTF